MDYKIFDGLPYNKITLVFNNTTNTYKHYWFWAILELIQTTDKTTFTYDEISIKMMDLVWYPLNFFNLSFGKQDSFIRIAQAINQQTNIENRVGAAAPSEQLQSALSKKDFESVLSEIRKLTRYVPYRFIRTFFAEATRGIPDSKVNEAIRQLANQDKENIAPYRFNENGITINPNWKEFFIHFYKLNINFIHRNLIAFLQKHNPNTIGISSKLEQPSVRNLSRQRTLILDYLNVNPNQQCIYSNISLDQVFSLDHFIPWSYVVHDHIWNLVPVTKAANSSKSNHLPDFNRYFNPFVDFHYELAKFVFDQSKKGEHLESYMAVVKEETLPDKKIFKESFESIFTPLKINATSLGFGRDWVYG